MERQFLAFFDCAEGVKFVAVPFGVWFRRVVQPAQIVLAIDQMPAAVILLNPQNVGVVFENGRAFIRAQIGAFADLLFRETSLSVDRAFFTRTLSSMALFDFAENVTGGAVFFFILSSSRASVDLLSSRCPLHARRSSRQSRRPLLWR